MKINQVAIVGILSGAVVVAGCSRGDQDLLAVRIELNALKHELEYLRQQTEDLEPRVLSTEQMALQAFDDRDAPLRLDCAGRSPGVLPTRVAALATLCDEAVLTDRGLRVRLKVGNPTSARLDRLALTFYAGAGAARGRSERRLFHEAHRGLAPGTWTSIEVDFDGLDAESARELAVRAEVGGVALAAK